MNIHQHTKARGLRPWHRYWLCDKPANQQEEHVIFPLVMPGGKFVGHQRYFWRRPKLRSNDEQGRYITTFLPEYKLTGFYGWRGDKPGPLFLTEGIWDSLRVRNCWYNCWAMLCNSPSKQLKQYIRMLAGSRPIVALCDKDENGSGEKLGRWCDAMFFPAKGYQDFNAMPHEVCFPRMEEICKCL